MAEPEPAGLEPERWDRMEDESARAFAAFCAYRDLGPQRSLVKAAKVLGKARATLTAWSGRFDWTERVRAWDEHAERLQRERDLVEHAEARGKMWEDHARSARRIWKLAAEQLTPEDEAEARKKIADYPPSVLMAMVEKGMEREARSRMHMTGRGVDPKDAAKLTDELIEIALRYMPEESQAAFLSEIESWAMH